jgi:hypothetical protein
MEEGGAQGQSSTEGLNKNPHSMQLVGCPITYSISAWPNPLFFHHLSSCVHMHLCLAQPAFVLTFLHVATGPDGDVPAPIQQSMAGAPTIVTAPNDGSWMAGTLLWIQSSQVGQTNSRCLHVWRMSRVCRWWAVDAYPGEPPSATPLRSGAHHRHHTSGTDICQATLSSC